MSDNKQLNKNHRWLWKLVMDTFKAHKDINETPLPKFAHVIAGDIARPVAERITELQAEVARLGELYAKEGRKTQVLLEEHSNLKAKLRVVAELPRYDSVEAFTHNAELTVDDERWIKASQVEALLREEGK